MFNAAAWSSLSDTLVMSEMSYATVKKRNYSQLPTTRPAATDGATISWRTTLRYCQMYWLFVSICIIFMFNTSKPSPTTCLNHQSHLFELDQFVLVLPLNIRLRISNICKNYTSLFVSKRTAYTLISKQPNVNACVTTQYTFDIKQLLPKNSY